MKISETKLKDVYIIEQNTFIDNRGLFSEFYNKNNFTEFGFDFTFIQDNYSISKYKDILRGLHYQSYPYEQTKLVSVFKGAIYDVVVDIRENSDTYGKYISVVLTEDDSKQILIPKGFAHGFCTLKPNTRVFYKVDNFYSPNHDKGVIWNDPELNIKWPTDNPILSEKDEGLPLLKHI